MKRWAGYVANRGEKVCLQYVGWTPEGTCVSRSGIEAHLRYVVDVRVVFIVLEQCHIVGSFYDDVEFWVL
jgi:hypothetical protein